MARKHRPPRKTQTIPTKLSGATAAQTAQLLALVADLADRVARLEADADEALEGADRMAEVRDAVRRLRGESFEEMRRE